MTDTEPTLTGTEPSLRSSLPGAYYTSAAMYATELERIFSKSWLCVERVETLDQAGRVLSAEVAGESVLVTRDKSGELHAFLNVCRHRGTRLRPTGSCEVGTTIRCPYHGWTYGLDGRLLSAPNLRDMPDFVKSRHGLLPVAVTDWAGYVWVCLETPVESLSRQVEPQLLERFGAVGVFEQYGVGGLGVAKRIVYDVHANWKALVENFTECYHCPTIHPELTAAVPEFSSGYGSISGGYAHGAEIASGLEGFSRSGRASGRTIAGLEPATRRRFYGVILLPNVFLILVPDHVCFFRLEPISANRTTVTCDWLFEPQALADPAFDPSDAVELLDITNRQDFRACEACQLGAGSRGFRDGGVLVPSEHLIVEFHEYLKEAIGLPAEATWRRDVEDLRLTDG